MAKKIKNSELLKLQKKMAGELRSDHLSKIMYATDASAYREIPLGVAIPQSKDDLFGLVDFARKNQTSLIPRGAGTSLAGQVVGGGLVVDVSRHFNRIIEINTREKWVRVEPGVVLTELNMELEKHGLMFGPETSTANRCTMGGMLGNNSCGLHSLVHGSVRDHILGAKAILADGSEAEFSALTENEFQQKLKVDGLEGNIYRTVDRILSDAENRSEIEQQYPHPSVPRRNNGYALDMLARMQPYNANGEPFNMAKFIAGSEGTLVFVTEMKLNLVELPPREKALLCVHMEKLEHAFKANLIALEFNPSAIELMDKNILDLTNENISQRRNRFFIEGEPAAILIIELWGDEHAEITGRAASIEKAMKAAGYGYHFPLVWGSDITRVWNLRKAGLGVLSNMPGDAKPVSVVEDTAIPVQKLPDFLSEFQQKLNELKLQAVYHAHIATGELHLRPVLNLKDENDVVLFRTIAVETAHLVKKYRGSLSGEHGDGRLRGEFIPFMLGEKVYAWLKEIKHAWDPNGIFNPGKITDTPPMDTSLRFEPGAETPEFKTYFDYKITQGMARAIEKCNGSGDCRKSEIVGGTMCPSFMATRDEMHSTRGRANVLRELITRPTEMNWADKHEILESLDLCLSCKACKSECPSGVDIAKLKAEFLQNHYDANPTPLRSRLIAAFPSLITVAMGIKPLATAFMHWKPTAFVFQKITGFTVHRPLPRLPMQSFNKWQKKHVGKTSNTKRKVYLFADEFVKSTDSHIGIKAIMLLEKLGYEVLIPDTVASGRTYLSKGFVRKAAKLAAENVRRLKKLVSSEVPLVGIEPSAILTFRDEYPGLVPEELKSDASKLAEDALMFDEFFMREVEKGNIAKDAFTQKKLAIKLHGHCHQKALSTTRTSIDMLQFPENYSVEEIPSGCCGMAGSFGYEKEHYEVSMEIGEMVLFPAVRHTASDVTIAAPGTSCREQIEHGTGRKALHPIEIIFNSLR